MHPSFYRQTASIEEQHWWFRHRRRLVERYLQELEHGAAGLALDIGCGTGGNLSTLAQFAAFTIGLDRSPIALGLARRRAGDVAWLRADANRLSSTIAPRSVRLAAVLNVLYHEWIEDDAACLASVHEVLEPGGRLVLCEPAFAALRRRHDRVDFGARRYSLGQLRGKVLGAGFELERSSYFNALSLVPAAALALADRWRKRLDRPLGAAETVGELGPENATLQSWLYRLHALERLWLRGDRRLPCGVGIVIVARRSQVGT